jgi:hypothetical protein
MSRYGFPTKAGFWATGAPGPIVLNENAPLADLLFAEFHATFNQRPK